MSDTLYHATRYENAGDIVVTGLEPRGMEQDLRDADALD